MLHEFNRTAIPYKQRLACTDKLRDPINYVGASLNKYYIDVGFPLTEKAHKIAVLTRELHNGLAISYKSVISDIILLKQGRVEQKLLSTAIHRAVYHLSKMTLISVLVYDSFPKWTWLELHTLHRLARRYDLESLQLEDPLQSVGKISSIEQAYRRILLFSLASPFKIRQRENIQIYDLLLEWANYTCFYRIDDTSTETSIIVQQDLDITPYHGTSINYLDSKHVVKLDVSELIQKLRQQFDNRPENPALQGIGSLDKNLLRQLIQLWSCETKRMFMRTRLNFEIRLAVGINNIYHSIRSKQELASANSAKTDPKTHPRRKDAVELFGNLSKFSLEPLEVQKHIDIRRDDFAQFGPHSQDPESPEPDIAIWDKPDSKQDSSTIFIFHTLNESAGGYCVDWHGKQAPKILVGEVIGIQSSMPSHQFGIGLVRWLKSNPNERMQVGLQMLAPDAVAVKVRNSDQTEQPAYKCLLLPEVGSSGQPISLVCPAFPFKVGDLLTIDDRTNERKVKLTRLLESSGSIYQFQFIYLDQPESDGRPEVDDAGIAKHMDFDNLWSTI
jgi:hypothetical protein